MRHPYSIQHNAAMNTVLCLPNSFDCVSTKTHNYAPQLLNWWSIHSSPKPHRQNIWFTTYTCTISRSYKPAQKKVIAYWKFCFKSLLLSVLISVPCSEFCEKKYEFDLLFSDPWEFPAPPSLGRTEFFIQEPRKKTHIDADDQSSIAFTPPSSPPLPCSSSSSSSQLDLSDGSNSITYRRRARPMSENLSDRKSHVGMATDDIDDERYHISRRGRFLITSEVPHRWQQTNHISLSIPL